MRELRSRIIRKVYIIHDMHSIGAHNLHSALIINKYKQQNVDRQTDFVSFGFAAKLAGNWLKLNEPSLLAVARFPFPPAASLVTMLLTRPACGSQKIKLKFFFLINKLTL